MKRVWFAVLLTGAGMLSGPTVAATRHVVDSEPAVAAARRADPSQPPVAPAGLVVSPEPPSIIFGQLFRDVQLAQVFEDQKTFCDLIPNGPPAKILADYATRKRAPGFSLRAFVSAHFRLQPGGPIVHPAPAGQPVQAYIAALWNVLLQRTNDVGPDASLLPLPHPFVVPGGRFTEMYYWDSYFTMLGLEADGRHDISENMVADFASEIDRYGHIPNGNRTYYLSRSQPPFFAKMVDLIAERDGPGAYRRYLPQLAREYDYWMTGANDLPRGQASQHVVRLADGTVLNRYWDARDVPRDESYRQDVLTARSSMRPPGEVYRNLRASAESGWDFSSRWFADGKDLATVETLDLLPVDLNSLIEHLERTLARAYAYRGDATRARLFAMRANVRAAEIRKLMWDRELQFFCDYSWRKNRLTHRVTAAALYPLFFGIASKAEADSVATIVSSRLLKPNGIATTLVDSGQQWDEPNGWAPLQWIAVAGLNAYGHHQLAASIVKRWKNVNLKVFYSSGKLVEKYDVFTPSGGGGGEYATQIGFGWTNGVLRKLMTLPK
jgi:alpha,alpha-trehalase